MEISRAIDDLTQAIISESLPSWLTYASALAPIFLTIISLLLTIAIDRRNRQLQVYFHQKEAANELRSIILEVFNSCLDAYMLAELSRGRVAQHFASQLAYIEWSKKIETFCYQMQLCINRARIIMNDDELINTLEQCAIAWSAVYEDVNSYIGTNIPEKTIEKAWQVVKQENGIEPYDFGQLYQNQQAKDLFEKECQNIWTWQIENRLDTYRAIVTADSFDKGFRKHFLNETDSTRQEIYY